MSTSESGPVLKAFHTTLPSAAFKACIQPRTPNSPPELPTKTFPLTTMGAIVTDSPLLMSPTCVFQTSLPVAASTATVCASSVL